MRFESLVDAGWQVKAVIAGVVSGIPIEVKKQLVHDVPSLDGKPRVDLAGMADDDIMRVGHWESLANNNVRPPVVGAVRTTVMVRTLVEAK